MVLVRGCVQSRERRVRGMQAHTADLGSEGIDLFSYWLKLWPSVYLEPPGSSSVIRLRVRMRCRQGTECSQAMGTCGEDLEMACVWVALKEITGLNCVSRREDRDLALLYL